MNWFNRILVLALILYLSRTPLPWGHSHCGMDTEQLAIHLHKYHPTTTSQNELPKGWHWHVVQREVATDGEVGQYPLAMLQVSFGRLPIPPIPEATNSAFAALAIPTRTRVSTDIAWAQAIRQQQTYLRVNVLLI